MIAVDKKIEILTKENSRDIFFEKEFLTKILAELSNENINQFKKKLKNNINKLILPVLNKIDNSRAVDKTVKKYIGILKNNFIRLTNESGIDINFLSDKLSERELEIANLILNDMRNKEISDLLNISLATIERHRYNIRKKFNLINGKCNLKSFLKSKTM